MEVTQIVSIDRTGQIIGYECSGVLLPHMRKLKPIWGTWPKTSFAPTFRAWREVVRCIWLLVSLPIEKLDEVFTKAGFEAVERVYVERRTVNKKENVDVPRIFIQGRYRKISTPMNDDSRD